MIPAAVMRLFCLTNYYDEPNLLDAIADAIDCGCTDVILLDGAYAHYPHKQPLSPPEQAQAVLEHCAQRDIPCIHASVIGATEAEKRTMLFDLAYAHGATASDWLFIQDADQTITLKQDIKPLLVQAKHDVFYTMAHEYDRTRFPTPESRRRWTRQTIRAIDGLHVDPYCHWRYLDGKGRVIWGYNAIPANGDLPILLHNNSTARGKRRNHGRDAYYDARTIHKVEHEAIPEHCYHCDQPPTAHINTDLRFEQAIDGGFGTSHRRIVYVCDRHLPKVKARNDYDLQQAVKKALRTTPELAARWVKHMRGGGMAAQTSRAPRIAPSQLPPPSLSDVA